MGKGGNVIFQVGAGSKPEGEKVSDPGGDFIFQLSDGSEMIRIMDDGSFFVRGDKVGQDAKLFTAFREWLEHATVVSREGGLGIGVRDQAPTDSS